MQLSRRAILHLSGLCASALALTGCAGTSGSLFSGSLSHWLKDLLGGTQDAASSAASQAPASSTAQSVSPALPEYDADPLTGEARRSNGRLVGVMVNNISNSARQNARPQRGIGAADLLIESKVEGGISRLCAVFHDVDEIPEVGPIRSGRDQFLQLIMPWRGLFYHDGESVFCTQIIRQWRYWDLNIGGKNYSNTPTHPLVAHRDSRGRDVAYEHTEFTSGKEIRQAAENAGIGLQDPCEDTFFRFADYRTGEVNHMWGKPSGRTVEIVHSEHYKTLFSYDLLSQSYKMQMYSRAEKAFADTVDELTGQQLAFDNLLVCFASIAAYPGDSADVQQVDYAAGGEAYFFTRGGMEAGRWEKPAPDQPLKAYGADGQELVFNRGKTYLAVVDDDEWPNFRYQ
ncbi:MAG: DUF3048 domain-containing protein [Faecalibacterium sp.]